MLQNNLGRSVKWQDGKGVDGGGHRTGRVVLLPDGTDLVCEQIEEGPQIRWLVPRQDGRILFMPPLGPRKKTFCFVKESCDGRLTWVEPHLLQPWQDRCPKCGGDGCAKCVGLESVSNGGMGDW